MSFQEIGTAFIQQYYAKFDLNRADLSGFFADTTMMTFEGQQFQGGAKVMEKLLSLPFKQVQHVVTTIDCQPSLDGSNIIIFVVGQLKTDDDPPHSFSEVFVLGARGDSYFVQNMMFRLSLHHG